MLLSLRNEEDAGLIIAIIIRSKNRRPQKREKGYKKGQKTFYFYCYGEEGAINKFACCVEKREEAK